MLLSKIKIRWKFIVVIWLVFSIMEILMEDRTMLFNPASLIRLSPLHYSKIHFS
jgi:uncharacterized membrane protein